MKSLLKPPLPSIKFDDFPNPPFDQLANEPYTGSLVDRFP